MNDIERDQLEQVGLDRFVATSLRVARHALVTCHCYGHLCGHCEEARAVIAMQEKHIHVALYEDTGTANDGNQKLTDYCALCGLSFRDEIHAVGL